MTHGSDWIGVAHSIGRRIVRDANWSGSECSWIVTSPDRTNPISGSVRQEVCGPTIYHGSAGIALFLSELGALTGDADVLRCAEGGLRYAIERSVDLPPVALGFHSGRVGIAYVLARHATNTMQDQFMALAQEMVATCYGFESQDLGLDVIGGAAGAIPALLLVGEMLDDKRATQSAIAHGLSLIEKATKQPIGWSWGSGAIKAARDLAGYAHGASGYAHAFLELYAATGNSSFRYAAEQAMLYEDTAYSESQKNWADYRNHALVDLLDSSDARSAITELERSGRPLPVYRPHYMNAWCHGAPGIGLARLRALEVLREEKHERTARIAVNRTIRSLIGETANCSLCHGSLGNCETILKGSLALGESGWFEGVIRYAEHAAHAYELKGLPWPSGVMGAGKDPSLLVGEAGIGHFYLRLASADVPSVLLLQVRRDTSETQNRNRVVVAASGSGNSVVAEAFTDVQRLCESRITRYFARTIAALHKLVDGTDAVRAMDAAVLQAADAFEFRDALLERVLPLVSLDLRDMAADAMRPDLAMLDLITAHDDEGLCAIERARTPRVTELEFEAERFKLAISTKVIETKYDWNSWLSSSEQKLPALNESYQLLRYRAKEIVLRNISSFAFLVLTSLQKPTSFTQLLDEISSSVEYTDDISEADVQNAVLKQLKDGCATGYIAVASELPIAKSPELELAAVTQ